MKTMIKTTIISVIMALAIFSASGATNESESLFNRGEFGIGAAAVFDNSLNSVSPAALVSYFPLRNVGLELSSVLRTEGKTFDNFRAGAEIRLPLTKNLAFSPLGAVQWSSTAYNEFIPVVGAKISFKFTRNFELFAESDYLFNSDKSVTKNCVNRVISRSNFEARLGAKIIF